MASPWDTISAIYGKPQAQQDLEAKYVDAPVGRERLDEQSLTMPSQDVLEPLNPTAAQQAQINERMIGRGEDALGWLTTIHGPSSKLANLENLRRAQSMEGDMANIWRETGWYQGQDGKWRFEVPDTNSQFRPNTTPMKQSFATGRPYVAFPTTGPAPPLRNVFSMKSEPHPATLGYPEIGAMPVRGVPASWGNIWGTFSPTPKEIHLAGLHPETATPVLLHELQHAIQHQEGFSTGASVDRFLPNKFRETSQVADDAVRALTKKMLEAPVSQEASYEERIKKLQEIRQYLANVERRAFNQYENIPGEREARNVEYRFRNPESYSIPPWQTEGLE